MVTCDDCSKKFKVKLNRRNETTCPHCGYVIHFDGPAKWFMHSILIPLFLVALYIMLNINTGLSFWPELLVVVGTYAAILKFIVFPPVLWIAGKIYDRYSK